MHSGGNSGGSGILEVRLTKINQLIRATRALATTHPKVSLKWWETWHTLPVKEWVLASRLFEEQAHRQAIPLYELGLKLAPHHPAAPLATIDLSFCRFSLGDLNGALELLKELTAKDDAPRDALVLYAKLLTVSGLPHSAAATLRRAARLYPNDLGIRGRLLQLLCASGFPRLEAVAAWRELSNLMSDSAAAEEQSVDDAGSRNEAELGLVTFELRFGNLETASKSADQLKAKGILSAEMLLLRARIWENTDDIDNAFADLESACEAFSTDPRPLIAQASLCLKLANAFPEDNLVSRAKELAEMAGRASSWKHAHAVAILAEVHRRQNDLTAAHLFVQFSQELPSYDELDEEVSNWVDELVTAVTATPLKSTA